METLTELLTALSGLSDVATTTICIVVVVWIINKFLEKQQEQQLLSMEEHNKTVQAISEYTEAITRLISLIESDLDKTKEISNDLESFQDKILEQMQKLDEKIPENNKKNDTLKG